MPQAAIKSKVWVVLFRNGAMTRVYGVYNSGGTAQLLVNRLNAKNPAGLFTVEGARVQGPDATDPEDDAGT